MNDKSSLELATVRSTKTRILFFMLLLIVFPGSVAWACSCGIGPVCIAHRRLGALFLGTVLQMQTVTHLETLADGSEVGSVPQRVVFVRVEKDFTSGRQAGEVVKVVTGIGGGDCGYPFREGERYVIDIEVQGDVVSTSTCSDTRGEAEAGLLLRDLRRAAQGEPSLDVSGIVTRTLPHYTLERAMPQPLPDLAVLLTGLDGTVYRTRTEADGVFELARVPFGVYGVRYELPPGLKAFYDSDPRSLVVPYAKGHGEAGCELSMAVYSASELSGQVLDVHGNGVEGALYLSDRVPGSSQAEGFTTIGSTGTDGFFHVDPLEAGLYWISFVPKGSTEVRWFYPGTRQPENAAPIKVEGGRPIDGLVFALGR